MADKLGGVQALADALLCSPRTVNRWATGDTIPDARSWAWIDDVFKRNRIKPPEVTP
jgi:hypothetical protein